MPEVGCGFRLLGGSWNLPLGKVVPSHPASLGSYLQQTPDGETVVGMLGAGAQSAPPPPACASAILCPQGCAGSFLSSFPLGRPDEFLLVQLLGAVVPTTL